MHLEAGVQVVYFFKHEMVTIPSKSTLSTQSFLRLTVWDGFRHKEKIHLLNILDIKLLQNRF